MSDKELERVRDDVKELYNDRNEHEKRLSLVEKDIGYIKGEQATIREEIKDYHTESIKATNVIQKTIDSFIKEVNGIPVNNKNEIEKQDDRIRDIEDHINQDKGFWEGIDKSTVKVIAILGLIGAVMAYLLRFIPFFEMP